MRCRTCTPVPEEVRRAADLLERRWVVHVVYAAHDGALRFNEFRQAIGGIPPRTLAERLRELERAGLLERRVLDGRPPLVEYRLTERGEALAPLVRALRRFAGTSGRSSAARAGDRVQASPQPK